MRMYKWKKYINVYRECRGGLPCSGACWLTINIQRIAGAEQDDQPDGQQQVCKFKFHIGMYFEK